MSGKLANIDSRRPNRVSCAIAIHPRFQLIRSWIEVQVQLESILSDFKLVCSRYQQLCQELDLLFNYHPREKLRYLQPECDRGYQEIATAIDEMCQLSLQKIALERLVATLRILLFFF